MQAHLLSLNNFGMPKVLSEDNAAYTKIIYLIMLEKGKYQSHPNMGVGIRSRYRFNNSENLLEILREDIMNQIKQYLPELSMVDISLTLNSITKVINILIDTNNGTYAVSYNPSTDSIKAGSEYILEDL